ncbi:MAG: thiamine biosynthesis protein ThiS [Pelagibacteraceae bacterium TMED216]|nr:MAG: thiamine biosynthesis protein ThiS [Pelagibacteraceae bacterium TMED216]|tara:strand:+ start:1536 stop:1739 length:204 start_codon:yes stop_codon:yes gene_type:complete
MAKIQLNGKKIVLKSKTTLFTLLKKYKLNKNKVAVELNGEIIPKPNYNKKFLCNKDRVEIVHFIGGG